jgi:hypothetical protein
MENEYQAPQAPEQMKKTMWILWGALIFSMVLYGALGTFLHSQNALPQDESQYSTLLIPIIILALLETAFITTFWDKILTPPHGEVLAFFTPFLLRMALSESIGLFGLMLCFIGAPLWVLFAFLAWGILLQVSLAPSETAIQSFRQKYGPTK